MRVTPLARRLGSAALVLTLGAGLTACSGDEPTDSSSATDEGAEDGTDDGSDDSTEETADAEEPAQASLQEFSAAEFYPAVMEALREAETFSFSTTSEAQGQATTMSGQARFGDDGVDMAASSTGAQAMEIILLDQVMYMKSPDMGTGDKYLEIDLSDPNSLFGMLGKATDPEVMFQALETPEKLELVGEEEVDGVATHHYRITIDPADYLEAMEFPDGDEGVPAQGDGDRDVGRRRQPAAQVRPDDRDPLAGRGRARPVHDRGHLQRLRPSTSTSRPRRPTRSATRDCRAPPEPLAYDGPPHPRGCGGPSSCRSSRGRRARPRAARGPRCPRTRSGPGRSGCGTGAPHRRGRSGSSRS